MPRAWEPRGERQRVYETRIFQIARQQRISPRTGNGHDFFVVDCADWCNIVPVTAAGEVVMVRQHRYGTDEETLEIPGGMIDPGDASPMAAAQRELIEETGYQARDLVQTGVIAPNPAMQSNRTFSFLARGVEKVRAPELDAGEEIDVVLVPLAEIPGRIARGEISHALVVVAFAYALGLQAPPAP